jgi:hypothetical protein
MPELNCPVSFLSKKTEQIIKFINNLHIRNKVKVPNIRAVNPIISGGLQAVGYV